MGSGNPRLGPRNATAVPKPSLTAEAKPTSLPRPAEAEEGPEPEDLPADLDAMRAETREWLKRIDESGAPGQRPAAPESKAAEGEQLKTVVVSGLDAGRKGRSAKGGEDSAVG